MRFTSATADALVNAHDLVIDCTDNPETRYLANATCQRLMDAGITINRPPRDGRMAFVRSPDNISIELLQEGEAQAPAEPWASMENTGVW